MPVVQVPKEHPAFVKTVERAANALYGRVLEEVGNPHLTYKVLLAVWSETSNIVSGHMAYRVFMEAIGIAREKAGIPYRAADDPRLD